jgi:predicted ATP-binding protein involved in virulence
MDVPANGESRDVRCFLRTVDLSNFRCFPEIRLEFHENLTVFVAPNGGGKSAVLDAVAVALRLFVDTLEGGTGSRGFGALDLRLQEGPGGLMEPVGPVRLSARARLLGEEIRWEREKASIRSSRTTTAQAGELRGLALDLIRENQRWGAGEIPAPPPFPLIAYYGTGRLWGGNRLTKGKRGRAERIPAPNARFRGYTDCLSSSSHYKIFADWFRRYSYEAQRARSGGRPSPHAPELLLEAVRRAVDGALREASGWHTLEWDFVSDLPRACHDVLGRLPVDALSDGIRTMIGLVADLAHRAILLNPHLGGDAPRRTPGIVLIDEVDLHLHPQWQQIVLPSLREAFPGVQLIVTTHSPQVLSTVDRASIRVLHLRDEGASAEAPRFQTRGVESADALSAVMGVDPVPRVEEARWLADYRALIEEGDPEGEEALSLRARLGEHFGEDHPAMRDCDRLIRFQAFRRRRGEAR